MLSASWPTVARLALGCGTLALVCKVRGYAFPRAWTVWGRLAVAGLLSNVAPYFLFAVGEHLTSSAYAGILNGTTPLWTVLAHVALGRRLPARLQAVGLLVGFAGTVLVDGGAVHAPQLTAVLAVVVLGVAGTGVAYVLNYALLTSDGPTTTSLVAYLIPVVAAVLGVLVLGEQLPPLAGLGAALVLLGVALVRRRGAGAGGRSRPADPADSAEGELFAGSANGPAHGAGGPTVRACTYRSRARPRACRSPPCRRPTAARRH